MLKKNLFGTLTVTFLLLLAVPCAFALGIGDVIPETIKVQNMEGKDVTLLSQVKGEKSVALFLTSACNKCLQEMKYLLENYNDQKIVVISVDMGGVAAMERWKKMYLYEYNPGNMTIVLDPEFIVAPQFGISTTPASLFLDKEGKIVNVKAGFNNGTKSALKEFFGK